VFLVVVGQGSGCLSLVCVIDVHVGKLNRGDVLMFLEYLRDE
jgi:hypothetical protein